LNPLIEMLEREGLVFPDRLEQAVLSDRPFKEVLRVGESLEATLSSSQQNSETPCRRRLDPFAFLASSSLRGDSGCAQPDCRLGKLDSLARYAALYSDQVILPFQLHLHCGKGKESHMRASLLQRIQAILMLRPAIEAGIVQLVPDDLHCCEQHLKEKVPEYKDIRALQTRLYKQNLPKFTVTFRARTCRHTKVEITGPPQFIEHGRIFWLAEDPPNWTPKAYLTANGKIDVELAPRTTSPCSHSEKMF
jgi:hypothetical protein